MERLYRQLYKDVRVFQTQNARIRNKALSVHVPMAGLRYDESPVRLLWIGRAINGWNMSLTPEITADAFSAKAENELHDRSRFSWLGSTSSKDCYCYKRSAFWRTCRLVCEQLGVPDCTADDWHQSIAWANLYPVAPTVGGNPSSTLCKAQKRTAGMPLKVQIECLRPTHIVFITDKDWFDDFNKPSDTDTLLFPNVNFTPSPSDHAIVGSGYIDTGKVVVTKRPEYHFTNAEFSKAIAAAFSKE